MSHSLSFSRPFLHTVCLLDWRAFEIWIQILQPASSANQNTVRQSRTILIGSVLSLVHVMRWLSFEYQQTNQNFIVSVKETNWIFEIGIKFKFKSLNVIVKEKKVRQFLDDLVLLSNTKLQSQLFRFNINRWVTQWKLWILLLHLFDKDFVLSRMQDMAVSTI